jgi:hypothetical protein
VHVPIAAEWLQVIKLVDIRHVWRVHICGVGRIELTRTRIISRKTPDRGWP